jgi:sugar O-acyltransferase (sialic acid O-acetyltransferase NeuD family)
MKTLYIAGASGHGKVVADIAYQTKEYEQIFFLDDDREKKECMGLPVVGVIQVYDFMKSEECEVIVAIGNNRIRKKKQEMYEQAGIKIATLIHPTAVLALDVHIGEGTVIMANAVVNIGTVLGKGCIINTAATVDHDNVIGEYSHISVGSHLAGTVTVGNMVWIGIGAVVSNNLTICEECYIGAGAVVVKDIEQTGTYIGVPARRRER